MSQFVVYLKVKPFIAQWLAFHYGTPVRFPDQSAENACIRRFLTRQPGGIPKMQGEGEVAVCIPDSKQKPVITYNHLGIHARAALVDCIEDTFRLQLWHDLNGVEALRCPLLKAVRAWWENNGISIALLTSSRALTCDARQEKKTTDFSVKLSINHNDKRAVFVHGRSKPFKCSKL